MRRFFPLGAPSLLLALIISAPAAALDVIYLVRHAEKVDDWPAAPDLDAFRPLSAAGMARAEALAARLKGEGIAIAAAGDDLTPSRSCCG